MTWAIHKSLAQSLQVTGPLGFLSILIGFVSSSSFAVFVEKLIIDAASDISIWSNNI